MVPDPELFTIERRGHEFRLSATPAGMRLLQDTAALRQCRTEELLAMHAFFPPARAAIEPILVERRVAIPQDDLTPPAQEG